jgi:hypothetical protein
MAVIHLANKWVFLCEAHTASRMTQELLLKQVPGTIEIQPHHRPPYKIRRDYVIDDFTLVAAVRNPWDSLITKWFRPSNRQLPLHTYITNSWNHRDTEPSYHYANECDRIIWFEHLESDINRIFGGPFEFSHHDGHKSEDKGPWHTYYDSEQFQRVQQREDWKQYCEWFGYDVRLDGTVNLDERRREELTRPILGV